MPKELIKKESVLNHAIRTTVSSLTLEEQRLILVAAISETSGENNSSNLNTNPEPKKRICISTYATLFNVSEKEAYQILLKAADQLFERDYSYEYHNQEGQLVNVISRIISAFSYADSELELDISFVNDFSPLLEKIKTSLSDYNQKQPKNIKNNFFLVEQDLSKMRL